MPKTKLEVNFHYGKEDFNNIMKRLIRNKLKTCDIKEVTSDKGQVISGKLQVTSDNQK